ncbi:glycosyltransferase family 9 protein [Candidatus Nitrospira allomarina]|uniref:Glycosyltransferase family 9 protein n=1 Tax=Candidatus Nitrospira allomarina TaxID=3020900 RepID=A0AA96JXN6_9BACT|nr:glycosyltransferase family 9 protein [Candidatus Nitrospira allomarina]WNM56864.1 glycosyltransferase family 9 protein [Candidatus Nitrospira allomarina]
MNITPQRILVIKLSSLGDIVHALPAVAALRQRFPQARLTWMVKEIWAPILEGNPDIDDILSVNVSWQNWPHIIRTLRRGQFDLVVDFQGLFRSGIFGMMTGARTRVGFARAREGATWLYTHQVPLPETKPSSWRLLEVHAVDRNVAITTFLGARSSTPVFHLPQSSTDRLTIETMLQDAHVRDHEHLIALAPWTRAAMKSWPFQRFVDLAIELVQWPDVRVVLLGGASDISAAGAFDRLVPQGLINLVGRLSLPQLPSLLRRMHLLIGNDSALIHLAAGVGIPVVAIFGPTHPKATGPYPFGKHVIVRMELPCSPCGARTCKNPNYLECMESISLENLIREIKGIVGGLSLRKNDRVPATQFSAKP